MLNKSFRRTRRIILVLLILAATFSVFYFAVSAVYLQDDIKTHKNILFLCLDDTGYNTDAMAIIHLPKEMSDVTVLQIPRDTFADTGEVNCKINRLYYRFFEKTKNEKDALNELSLFLSHHLGIEINEALLLTLDEVALLIDAIGGVDIELPSDLFYSDPAQNLLIDLKKGKQHLSGKDAVRFARYRSGYKNGDLGRLDAQKLLSLSVIEEIKNGLSASSMLKLAEILKKDAVTTLSVRDMLSLGLSAKRKGSDLHLKIFTAPGEAVRYNGNTGVWYFSLNKKAMQTASRRYFESEGHPFDPENIFLGKTPSMQNVYFDTKIELKEFSAFYP